MNSDKGLIFAAAGEGEALFVVRDPVARCAPAGKGNDKGGNLVTMICPPHPVAGTCHSVTQTGLNGFDLVC